MRKFIVVLGMMFTLNMVCTGCGSRVSFIQSGETDSETTAEADDTDEEGEELTTDTERAFTAEGDTDSGTFGDSVSEDIYDGKLAVYVCGAVAAPGVYYFESGDIKAVALEAAGGFAEDAATDYVNLAEKLQDGEKLYFPYEEEVEAGDIKYSGISGTTVGTTDDSAVQESSAESDSSGKVNINTADKTELMTLPGIGESKAELIINYRESNGAFSTIEDIMNINGIKDGVYSKIKDYITVD
jgi:competence protein ComEA